MVDQRYLYLGVSDRLRPAGLSVDSLGWQQLPHHGAAVCLTSSRTLLLPAPPPETAGCPWWCFVDASGTCSGSAPRPERCGSGLIQTKRPAAAGRRWCAMAAHTAALPPAGRRRQQLQHQFCMFPNPAAAPHNAGRWNAVLLLLHHTPFWAVGSPVICCHDHNRGMRTCQTSVRTFTTAACTDASM